jgi:hypothetical protein
MPKLFASESFLIQYLPIIISLDVMLIKNKINYNKKNHCFRLAFITYMLPCVFAIKTGSQEFKLHICTPLLLAGTYFLLFSLSSTKVN